MLALTGTDIGAIIILVLMAVGVFFLVRWTIRLVKAPFRAARRLRRPASTGLGAEYEQLIRAKSKGIVLPEVRRVRASAPEPSRSSLVRLWRRPIRTPAWLTYPLIWLGGAYVILTPFGRDWYEYGTALFFAVLIGVWAARRYRVTILHREERSAVVWVRWGKRKKDAEPEAPPVIVPPS